jgi:hypothetical protein
MMGTWSVSQMMEEIIWSFVEWYREDKVEVFGRKPVPYLLSPPLISHGLHSKQIWASASRCLQPEMFKRPIVYSLGYSHTNRIESRRIDTLSCYKGSTSASIIRLDSWRVTEM